MTRGFPSVPSFSLRYIFGLLMLVATHAGVRTAWAFAGELDSVEAVFHAAEADLYNGKWDAASAAYQHVIIDARTLDLESAEWYRGMASFGVAHCCAARHQTAETRRWLERALSYHFWTFDVIRKDTPVVLVAGASFVDSLCSYWEAKRDEQRGRWRPWHAIIVRPRAPHPLRNDATIIALHGGNANLRLFAEQWQRVSDSLGITVIVPPGTMRISPVGFAWGSEMAPSDSSFRALLAQPDIRPLVHHRTVILAGFSQGGHVALGLALRHPDLVHGVIVIEGFNLDTISQRWLRPLLTHHSRIYGIFGDHGYMPFQDNFVRFRNMCQSDGIPIRMDLVAGMGHELPDDLPTRVLGALSWINEHSPVSHGRSTSWRK